MRLALTAAWIGLLATGAFAQSNSHASRPLEIGNRANGFSYQPTPSEVDGREEAVGVRPSAARQEATDKILAGIDKSLLRSEGLSTKDVPDFVPRK